MAAPSIASRVRLIHDVTRYPHFVAPSGATGTVVDMGDPNIYAVQMDQHIPGAEDWRNEIHWFDGDDPSLDLEEIA